MDFLDIIGTIIEFSKKEEEFSDEIKTIRATLTSLQLIMRQVDQQALPDHITQMLEENLKDSQDLLQKTSHNKSNAWWTSFKNMLPGSDLQKIKEKNQQLVHVINLLNLHLNTIKKGKRVLSSVSFPKDDEERKEINEDPQKRLKTSASRYSFPEKENIPNEKEMKGLRKSFSSFKFSYSKKATVEIKPEEEVLPSRPVEEIKIEEIHDEDDDSKKPENFNKRPAFRLKTLYSPELAEKIGDYPKNQPYIRKYWPNKESNEEVAYNFQRTKYMYLPNVELQKLSRDHAMLIAERRPRVKKVINTQELHGPTQDEQDDSWVYNSRVLFMSTQLDEGFSQQLTQNQNQGQAMEEEIEYEYRYKLKELSLNGTFFLRSYEKQEIECGKDGVLIEGDFRWMKKDEEMRLCHGDIIGLIMKKPESKELIFGFQFLLY